MSNENVPLVEKYDWEPVVHTVNSPDLTSSDYHWFASMSHTIFEHRFNFHKESKKWFDDWFGA